MTFDVPVLVQSLSLTFQGGFVGLQCAVYVKQQTSNAETESDSWVLSDRIYPEDVNRRQSFSLTNRRSTDGTEIGPYIQLRLVFEKSSDFFGRIVVYDLSIDGDLAGQDGAQ